MVKELEDLLDRQLPLVRMPDLAAVRAALRFEFADAADVIDRPLRDIPIRSYVEFRPTILVGPPGSSKTRSPAAFSRPWPCRTMSSPAAGHNVQAHDAQLAFLEPETACRFHDPSLQAPCNLSHITWLKTANTLEGLSAPLKDRSRVIRFPEPGPEHLPALSRLTMIPLVAARGLDHRWVSRSTRSRSRLSRGHGQAGPCAS